MASPMEFNETGDLHGLEVKVAELLVATADEADHMIHGSGGEVPALPANIGTFLSTPIVLAGGEVYGTLCCFSHGINPKITAQDVKTLRYTAQLTANKIGRARKSNGELEWPTLPPEDPVTKP